MAKADLPPFIVWRDGRPRFIPGPRVRGLGFRGEDLRHFKDPGAPWFTFEQARDWGEAKNREIEKATAGDGTAAVPPPAARRGTTVEDLLNDFLDAMRRKVRDKAPVAPKPLPVRTPGARRKPLPKISAATLRSYEMAARAVIHKPETRADAKERRDQEYAAALLKQPLPERPREAFALSPVSCVGAPELREFFDYAGEARGHHMAIAMIGVISAAFTWGTESSKWRLKGNPRLGMEFERPDGRVMLIPLNEFQHIVQAADLIGCSSIGHSWHLGLFTGQRQTDRLNLQDDGLHEGRRRFRQSKTGVLLHIKEARQLSERLEIAKKQNAQIRLARGTRSSEDKSIVLDETTGLPYVDSTYRHRFDEVRRAAVHGVILLDGKVTIADPAKLGADFRQRLHNQISWLLRPMPSCANKRDQDLRDTFVILTYRAMVKVGNVNLKAICDVSGHSYTSVQTIIKHYLGRDPHLADDAIDTLSDFVAKEMAG